MPFFRKKPVVIEAHQLPPVDEDCSDELMDFLYGMGGNWTSEKDGGIVISTLEGDMCAAPGSWIIKGIKGEYYPCDPEIFNATYERVDME